MAMKVSIYDKIPKTDLLDSMQKLELIILELRVTPIFYFELTIKK